MADAGERDWDDMILPFQLDRADIRGRIARLDRVLDHILDRHAYPAPVADLVAEACLLTALIGEAIKLRWRLSLQIRGDGPIRLIATDWFAPEEPGGPARLRAYAGFDRDRVPDRQPDPFALLGRGLFGITIDQGPGNRPYQGITPLAGPRLSDCAATYFAQSEQIATRFSIVSGLSAEPGRAPHWRAGGIMLQHMPKASPHAAAEPTGPEGLMAAADVLPPGEEAENWARVNILLDTAEAHELVGPLVSPDRLLLRLYHEERPRVFPPTRTEFGCTCSAEKVAAAMMQYSARDLAHMTTPEGRLTADCQFCSAHYELDPSTLGFDAKH